jgi:hypothetical protein
MSLLFVGVGESGTPGAAEEGRREVTTASGSLQDMVNNSISPFYIKKEIIERDDEDSNIADMEDCDTPEMVGVVVPVFEQSDPELQSEELATLLACLLRDLVRREGLTSESLHRSQCLE